jgi:acyl carrier protein
MKQPKRGRWKGDPIALSDEAFSMSIENQHAALDYMEEAPQHLRDALFPLWKFCFAQWIIFDAGKEAEAGKVPVAELLSSQEMIDDVESLRIFSENGGLDKCKKAEKWTWKMLEKLPVAGSADEYGAGNNSPIVQAAREERSDGCDDYNAGKWERAFWHFNQGIRHLARLPEPLTPLQVKLGCDLFKNVAAAALKLQMNRTALNAATAALGLSPEDQKAWFRKACALQNLDRDEEATEAFMYAGYVESEKELGPRVDPPTDMDTGKQAVIERLVFLECGIDSIDAVEMIAIIQDKLPNVQIPPSMVFDCPSVGEATRFLADKVNASQIEILEIVYRAMCNVLNRDPLKVQFTPKVLSEEKALGALLTLAENYRDAKYIQKCGDLAKKADMEYKPFLQSLRRHALECQVQTLEIRGFPPTFEGMRRLECALIACAKSSRQVKELLKSARVAVYGGPEGMWPHIMGDNC